MELSLCRGYLKSFCSRNGIKHVTTAPAHPSTNGLAENAVKDFKMGFKKALEDFKLGLHAALEDGLSAREDDKLVISRYLFAYRNALHSSTGETPAERMMGRKLRTRFDVMRENLQEEKSAERQVKNYAGKRELVLAVGDLVFAKDLRTLGKNIWAKAKITKSLGPRMYECQLVDGSKLIWRRHLDQLSKYEGQEEFMNREMVKNAVEVNIDESKGNIEIIGNQNNSSISLNEPVQENDEKKENRSEGREIAEFGEEGGDRGQRAEEKVVERVRTPRRELPSLNVNERPKRIIKAPARLDL